MQLEGVEVRWLDLALRRPVGTSAGTHHARPVILVRVVCGSVEGWGECGALAGGTAVDPPADEVWRALTAGGARRLLEATRARDGELPPGSQVAGLFGTARADRMSAAAVEMAVLDAELRGAGMSLGERLGTAGRTVAAGAVVGIPRDRAEAGLLADVEEQVALGFERVRLKIEPGWDRVPVAAVRREFPGLLLQADANGAYRLQRGAVRRAGPRTAGTLAALDPYGLACIEQPLPPGDLPSHATLAGVLETPVCLDESLTSLRRVSDAIRYGACTVACLKPSRLGGVFAARRAVEICRRAGVGAFVGGFFETGLARSANAALAALPGFTLPGDLSDPSAYLERSPWPYDPPVQGRVAVPGGPGIGPAGPVDQEILDACTAAARWYPLSGEGGMAGA